MFLFLKGSLVTQLTIAQDLHIECLSPALAVPLLIGSAMRSLLLVLVILVLLSYVPPGKMESLPCGIMNHQGKEGMRSYKSEEEAGLG